MISIQDFCDGEHRTLTGLKQSLQLAMQIEFATIPPYLCAQWSIESDPDRVEAVFHHIVGQEMDHLAMAGNLLAALGDPPTVARSEFLPTYPMTELPGGIEQKYPIALGSLTFEQLKVFMQIEAPAFVPVGRTGGRKRATIGDFYNELIKLIKDLNPQFDKNANFVPVRFWDPITSLDDAIRSLERVKEEGEGFEDTPVQPTPEGPLFSHYYLFRELYKQKRLVRTISGWRFSGDRIDLPKCHKSRKAPRDDPAQRRFSSSLKRLLVELDCCWHNGSAFNVGSMLELQKIGKGMFRSGLCPQFVF